MLQLLSKIQALPLLKARFVSESVRYRYQLMLK